MKLSYEGIGQWAATFACDDLAEGELVKVSANGTVAACAAGDDFCGMVLSVSRGGDACAVALGGMVTAGYTVPAEGAAPALGWSGLSADGEGGVQADADGSTYLVVDVDTTVVVIEHNLDVIKTADHIIDLGPEGGDGGGAIVCTGTPEEVAACGASYTGRYLKRMLE